MSYCIHELLNVFEDSAQREHTIASEKIEGHTTSLTFLGIIIDIRRMEIRLPEEKLARIQETLKQWLTKKNATKRKILSLVGQLQHATKVVRCDRTFTARMSLLQQNSRNYTTTLG